MERNDIAPTVHKRIACWFEDLIITKETAEKERRFTLRKPRPASEEDWVRMEVRSWRTNEMPLKSLFHMVNQLGMGVDVYTYMTDLTEAVEAWLARKGISVVVYGFDDFDHLRDEFKYNRDVHTLFTPFQEDAARLGLRCTVVNPDGTFGI